MVWYFPTNGEPWRLQEINIIMIIQSVIKTACVLLYLWAEQQAHNKPQEK
jgi:hypothetical protein